MKVRKSKLNHDSLYRMRLTKFHLFPDAMFSATITSQYLLKVNFVNGNETVRSSRSTKVYLGHCESK